MGQSQPDARERLLALYDTALPVVYGYLVKRCGSREIAEELTSETFLAAADAARRAAEPPVEVNWLIGVARHKLVDHWRRLGREERSLAAVATDPPPDDPWNAHLDALRVADVLQRLAAQHRAALTLRYVDDLPVPRVAELLGRTVHATEALLVRARAAFRTEYEAGEGDRD